MDIRDNLGRFIKGHICSPNWGFQNNNQYGTRHKGKKTGRIPLSAFLRGHTPWNKGKKASLETREKMVKNHKGMTGRSLSEENKRKIGESNRGKIVSEETRKKQSIVAMTRCNKPSNGNQISNCYQTIKRGYRIIDGNSYYFKSSWEANAARLLTFQKRKWLYEPKTFWFEKIKRGVRSYTPDFYLPDENIFIEIKGWMDKKSLTKLKRMRIYYPEVYMEVWDKVTFKAFKQQGVGRLITGWE